VQLDTAAEGVARPSVHGRRRYADVVPDLFYPQLPWFKDLEGEPGYADLVTELERRRATILTQLRALE
jgi:hypothetical protein